MVAAVPNALSLWSHFHRPESNVLSCICFLISEELFPRSLYQTSLILDCLAWYHSSTPKVHSWCKKGNQSHCTQGRACLPEPRWGWTCKVRVLLSKEKGLRRTHPALCALCRDAQRRKNSTFLADRFPLAWEIIVFSHRVQAKGATVPPRPLSHPGRAHGRVRAESDGRSRSCSCSSTRDSERTLIEEDGIKLVFNWTIRVE